jgi:anti-sigma regulatory factor (Ser/Thr protein kinase)
MSARGTARRRDSRRGQAAKAGAGSGPDATSALSVVFPGTPSSAPAARGFLRGVLAASPRLDDLELIVSELVTNAIRHTPSGQPGGSLTLTVEHGPGRARIEVGDLGTERWQPQPCDPSAEYGRGLLLVMALADGIGHDAIPGKRHRTWAEVSW